jgi:glycine/D-amino acid oxidase-like deaminating enzyme
VSTNIKTDIAVVGAGIAGIATAYYLCVQYGRKSVLLIDSRQPMSYTSAQSGDNYRNWWPHPTMVRFSNLSIDLMEKIRRDTDNAFNMTDRGYVLATRRSNIDAGTGDVHATHPMLAEGIENVIHIRRGGDISGQQLGSHMLGKIRDAGGKRMTGEVLAIEGEGDFVLEVASRDGRKTVRSEMLVNAAGPFAGEVAAMLGVDLPVQNIFQQKVAFDDVLGAIPRTMPFTIDLDELPIDWSEEERQMLLADRELSWLAERMPGGVHCRPDGGDKGSWVKLGWAYNTTASEPQQDLANEPNLDPSFAEIVIRRASMMIPALRLYIETPPTRRSHYGGYYTMTDENWPLIGPLGPGNAFVVGALSGFGSMTACAAGSICASWVCGGDLPDYAQDLSLARYDNPELMAEITGSANRGIL